MRRRRTRARRHHSRRYWVAWSVFVIAVVLVIAIAFAWVVSRQPDPPGAPATSSGADRRGDARIAPGVGAPV